MPNAQSLLPGISHGDHCCLLFSSPEDQAAVAVPFLAIGLERGERSVFVADGAALERIRHGLKDAGVAVERELENRRLVLDDAREFLDRGRFNTDKMLGFLQQTYEATIAEGFTALRATGDVSWQVGDEKDFSDVVYYETLLDVFFLGKRLVGMCQYPKSMCPPDVLSGILNTHRVAAIDLEICSNNFHYVPPQLLLENNPLVRHEKRVEWMTSQLLRATRAEEEILRLNADLERRVDTRTTELRAAYQDMESFSYSISHDLRAPLRAIDGFSAALTEDYSEDLDDEARDYLSCIRSEAKRMGILIEDLLQFSRVTRQELSTAHVDMNALARQAADAASASTMTVFDLPPALGDSSLLRQVLINLIGNAVKFSRNQPEPTIEMRARLEADEIVYSVTDNGAGFDMAHAGKLFGAFQRLHRQDEFEGTGVGLAIVHRIIRRHGGRVWAEGRVGEGATFYFTLRPDPGPPS
jgi:signal transduction histidine kinase